MELYKEIMELFGSCQPHNIALAEQLIEGQKIDKMQFLEHFGLVQILTGGKKTNEADKGEFGAWGAFIKTCNKAEIYIWGTQVLGVAALKCLSGLRKLKWGGISRQVPPINLAPIAEIQSLQEITIWYNIYDNYPEPVLNASNEINLLPLSKLTQLRKLSISGLNISDISVVEKLPNLCDINISYCYRIKSFKPLAEMGAQTSANKHIIYSLPFQTAGRKLYRQIAFQDYLAKLFNNKPALFVLNKRYSSKEPQWYKLPHRIANRPKCKNSNTLNTK